MVNPLHRGRVRDPKKPGEFYEPSRNAYFYLHEDAYLDQLPHEPPQLRQTCTNDGGEVAESGGINLEGEPGKLLLERFAE